MLGDTLGRLVRGVMAVKGGSGDSDPEPRGSGASSTLPSTSSRAASKTASSSSSWGWPLLNSAAYRCAAATGACSSCADDRSEKAEAGASGVVIWPEDPLQEEECADFGPSTDRVSRPVVVGRRTPQAKPSSSCFGTCRSSSAPAATWGAQQSSDPSQGSKLTPSASSMSCSSSASTQAPQFCKVQGPGRPGPGAASAGGLANGREGSATAVASTAATTAGTTTAATAGSCSSTWRSCSGPEYKESDEEMDDLWVETIALRKSIKEFVGVMMEGKDCRIVLPAGPRACRIFLGSTLRTLRLEHSSVTIELPFDDIIEIFNGDSPMRPSTALMDDSCCMFLFQDATCLCLKFENAQEQQDFSRSLRFLLRLLWLPSQPRLDVEYFQHLGLPTATMEASTGGSDIWSALSARVSLPVGCGPQDNSTNSASNGNPVGNSSTIRCSSNTASHSHCHSHQTSTSASEGEEGGWSDFLLDVLTAHAESRLPEPCSCNNDSEADEVVAAGAQQRQQAGQLQQQHHHNHHLQLHQQPSHRLPPGSTLTLRERKLLGRRGARLNISNGSRPPEVEQCRSAFQPTDGQPSADRNPDNPNGSSRQEQAESDASSCSGAEDAHGAESCSRRLFHPEQNGGDDACDSNEGQDADAQSEAEEQQQPQGQQQQQQLQQHQQRGQLPEVPELPPSNQSNQGAKAPYGSRHGRHHLPARTPEASGSPAELVSGAASLQSSPHSPPPTSKSASSLSKKASSLALPAGALPSPASSARKTPISTQKKAAAAPSPALTTWPLPAPLAQSDTKDLDEELEQDQQEQQPEQQQDPEQKATHSSPSQVGAGASSSTYKLDDLPEGEKDEDGEEEIVTGRLDEGVNALTRLPCSPPDSRLPQHLSKSGDRMAALSGHFAQWQALKHRATQAIGGA